MAAGMVYDTASPLFFQEGNQRAEERLMVPWKWRLWSKSKEKWKWASKARRSQGRANPILPHW